MASDQNLTISVHGTLESLERLRPEWDALLGEYPYSTTFSTYEWLVPWWKAFGGNDQLQVLSFRDDSSELVALAPMALTTRGWSAARLRLLRLLGDGSSDSDNLDLPVKPGFEERFASSFLHFLERGESSWDFVELNTLPPQSPGGDAVRQLLKRRKWVKIEKQRPASAIPLPGKWEQYLGQLSSENQKNLARYTRRLEKRYGVKIYRCSADTQLSKCLEALFEHHQARWEAAGEQGSFGSPERRRFYYELSAFLLARGWLDLWVLELDGAVAAAQFAFRYGRQVYQLQEGNDPKRASDRVGFVLRGHVMKQLIADGIHTYDFLAGNLGYKADWGAETRVYADIHFARPFSLGAVYLRALDRAGRSKSWLRRNLPQPVWDVLHKLNVRGRRADA